MALPPPPCTELALFSGAGGLSLGLHRAVVGLRTVCHVERDAFAAAVLVARMETADLDEAPVWDDVRTFDGRPWRGVVDCVAGGFPCQDVSNAGKRKGLTGERSGLWREFRRIVGEVDPSWVFIENVAALAVRGFATVKGDLEELGYDLASGPDGRPFVVLGADDVGAPHRRLRLFALAYRDSQRFGGERRGGLLDGNRPALGHDAHGRGGEKAELGHPESRGWKQGRTEPERQPGRPDATEPGGAVAHGVGPRLEVRRRERGDLEEEREAAERGGGAVVPEWPCGPDDAEGWRAVLAVRPDLAPAVEPAVRGMVDGLANRVDRLRLTGNGVVPAQAALAWGVLYTAAKGTGSAAPPEEG